MGGPRVTFVIPCFNHGKFVRDAARSAISQEGCEPSVVIVNDGSCDGFTPGACEACASIAGRIITLHQENLGLSAARNRGAAVGLDHFAPDFLVFLDADDWVRPGFVAKLHAAIVAGGGGESAPVSHAYCQEELVELGKGIWKVPDWDPVLLMVTNLHPVTALVRADAFRAAGGFDESMRDGYEDWDFWLKLASRGLRGVRVREPLFVWRRHSHVTMVMDAVKRHEPLYRKLIENHADLYQRHAVDVLARCNALLRKADANWLDENHDAIVIRDLRSWNADLVRERDEARAELAAKQAEARAPVAPLAPVAPASPTLVGTPPSAPPPRDNGHATAPQVKVSRRLHQILNLMPRPVAAPLRSAVRAVKSVVVRTRPASGAAAESGAGGRGRS